MEKLGWEIVAEKRKFQFRTHSETRRHATPQLFSSIRI